MYLIQQMIKALFVAFAGVTILTSFYFVPLSISQYIKGEENLTEAVVTAVVVPMSYGIQYAVYFACFILIVVVGGVLVFPVIALLLFIPQD